jgi:hypothetical protein
MRRFRSARLLVIPALVLPVVLSTVALPGTAWAKGAKTVTCRELTGTAGTTLWYFEDCTQPAITGGDSTMMSTPFPTAAGRYSVKVTWNPVGEAHRGGPAGTTTFGYSASQLVGHKNKCGTSSTEWELVGTVTANTVSPKVKGKLKAFVCVSRSHALTQKKNVRL